MIENLNKNLKLNNIDDGFEVFNKAFEDLDVEHVDLCVIDAYPGADTSEIVKKAEKITDNVVVI